MVGSRLGKIKRLIKFSGPIRIKLRLRVNCLRPLDIGFWDRVRAG